VAGRIQWLPTVDGGQPRGRRVPQGDGLQEYRYPPFLPHAATANLGVRRSVHEKVGGFDESWKRLMDTDYCWRIQLSGFPLNYAPGALVFMRTRDSILSMVKQAWLWGRFNVLLYKRYRPYGMPKLRLKDGAKKWQQTLAKVRKIRSGSDVDAWLWQMAWQLGRLDGSIRYRALAL
jgi:GT2 family glycosyltransferase